MTEKACRLNSAQLDFWRTNGYLVIPEVFNADEVAHMQLDAQFILELIINSSLCNQRQSRRLDIRKRSNGGMVVRKIQPINDLSLELTKVSQDQRLLGPMAELMGDEPILMEEKLNYKQPIQELADFRVPIDDDRFPVHNDWAYYLYNGYPDDIISSAITIDACHQGNGTLKVFPGTHQNHIEHKRVRNGLEVPKGSVNLSSGIYLDAPAGSVMFFHAKLVHTSDPNPTNQPRRVMIYSHYPKQADMGIDIRNGPTRLRESPWEWEYRRQKDAGEFEDQFKAEMLA